MSDPIPFRRPPNWRRLHADEAERIVRERAKDSINVIIGVHAYQRVHGRQIVADDVFRILREGYVEGQPASENGDWKVIYGQALTRREGSGSGDAIRSRQ